VAQAERWLELGEELGNGDATVLRAMLLILRTRESPAAQAEVRTMIERAKNEGNGLATTLLMNHARTNSWREAFRELFLAPSEDIYRKNANHSLEKFGDETSRPPRVISAVEPVYPLALRFDGTSGRVLLEVIVGKDGTPAHIKALESPHPALTESAIAAMKQWRFEPAIVKGQPAFARLHIPLIFNISSLHIPGSKAAASDDARGSLQPVTEG
jgi:TonB family protein